MFLTAMYESACFPTALKRETTVMLYIFFANSVFQMTNTTTQKLGRGGSNPNNSWTQYILTMCIWDKELNEL